VIFASKRAKPKPKEEEEEVSDLTRERAATLPPLSEEDDEETVNDEEQGRSGSKPREAPTRKSMLFRSERIGEEDNERTGKRFFKEEGRRTDWAMGT
jgi:hypothetical protein